ncbi:hypothetical protein ACFQL4_07325 [Halosimplex aquaticum]
MSNEPSDRRSQVGAGRRRLLDARTDQRRHGGAVVRVVRRRLLALAQYLPADVTVGGTTVATLLGGALTVAGAGVVALGAASYGGSSRPSPDTPADSSPPCSSA